MEKNRRNTLCEITCKCYENSVNQVSKRIIQGYLHKHIFRRRVLRILRNMAEETVKIRIDRFSWWLQKRWWTVDRQLKNVISSDESHIVVGGDNRENRVKDTDRPSIHQQIKAQNALNLFRSQNVRKVKVVRL
jgi:hypothetical protein